MRIGLTLIFLFMVSGAYAQQCGECTLADACIKEYLQKIAKIKAENKHSIEDWQKGARENKLSADLSRRGTLQLQESLGTIVRFEIEKLKDCLGKIK